MKRILTSMLRFAAAGAFLLATAQTLSAQEIKAYSDDYYRYSYFDYEDGGKVAQGYCVFSTPDGSIKAEGEYQEGYRAGSWTYINSGLQTTINYAFGKRYGEFSMEVEYLDEVYKIVGTIESGELVGCKVKTKAGGSAPKAVRRHLKQQVLSLLEEVETSQERAYVSVNGHDPSNVPGYTKTLLWAEIMEEEPFIEFMVVEDPERDQIKPMGDQFEAAPKWGESVEADAFAIPSPVPAEDKIFFSSDQMPTFPEGDKALLKYIKDHISYPEAALQEGVQGTVVLQFVVEKDGSIGEVKLIRRIHPELDKEAVRIAKSLPKFNPGMMCGRLVRVWFTIPVYFKLPTTPTDIP